MGANKPIEDIEATLLAATKSALDELVWWAHATMAAKAAEASFWSSPRRAGRPPVLRLRREGVPRRQARERFQSPVCGHFGYRSNRRGRPPGRLSIERRRGRGFSRGRFGETTRVRTRQAGKAQRVARWCTHAAALGSAHLPGSVQEATVIYDRAIWPENDGSETSD